MAKATPKSVTQAAEKLHRQYQWEYAGKPRHTRPVEPLERLIDKSKALLRKAAKLKGAPGREAEQLVRDRLALYRRERDLVAEARYTKPEVGQLHDLTVAVNRAVWTYRRHFAGQDRLSRDTGALRALIARLAEAEPKLRELLAVKRTLELSGALNTVTSQLEVMRDELSEIEDARRRAEPAALSRALGQRAAVLLDAYRVYFAGYNRLSCDPSRLDAMIAELVALDHTLEAPEHRDELADLRAQLRDTLALWRGELAAIERAHADAAARDRYGALGAAANRVFELYGQHFAGQDRGTRSLRLLSDLCDRLGDVLDQMIAAGTEDPMNTNNIGIVSERLRAYEEEFVQIAKVKEAQRGDPADPLGGFIRG